MDPDPLILRLPRVDQPQDEAAPFVLVHVSSAGSRPLDLDLIGTDNNSAFAVSCKVATDRRRVNPWPSFSCVNPGANQILGDLVKQNDPSSLGKKSSSVNQEDWEAILSAILLGTAPDTQHTAAAKDVEAIAKVEGDPATSLKITLQRRIGDIRVCAMCRVTNTCG